MSDRKTIQGTSADDAKDLFLPRAALQRPPGNDEFLKTMTAGERRQLMKELIERQRVRVKEMTGVLSEVNKSNGMRSFRKAGDTESDFVPEDINRAIEEMSVNVRMLDILEELMRLQDSLLGRIRSGSGNE